MHFEPLPRFVPSTCSCITPCIGGSRNSSWQLSELLHEQILACLLLELGLPSQIASPSTCCGFLSRRGCWRSFAGRQGRVASSFLTMLPFLVMRLQSGLPERLPGASCSWVRVRPGMARSTYFSSGVRQHPRFCSGLRQPQVWFEGRHQRLGSRRCRPLVLLCSWIRRPCSTS